jgi:hypothetical protein
VHLFSQQGIDKRCNEGKEQERSRRTNWEEWMTGLAGEQLHERKGYMVER